MPENSNSKPGADSAEQNARGAGTPSGQGPEAPIAHDPSEFTRMFRALAFDAEPSAETSQKSSLEQRQVADSAAPIASAEPAVAARTEASLAMDESFDALFGVPATLPHPVVPAPVVAKPVVPEVPHPVASPTPSPVAPQHEPPPPPASVAAFARPEAPPEGSTQIFQQIARPTSALPDLPRPVAPASAASDSGFTQIFSSFQAGHEPLKAPPAPAAANLSSAPPLAGPTLSQPPSPTSTTAPPPLPQPLAASPPAPGEFTQMFNALPATPAPMPAPSSAPFAEPTRPSAPNVSADYTPQRATPSQPEEAGSFTQMFQQPGHAQSGAQQSGAQQSSAQVQASAQPQGNSTDRLDSGPVFGAPPPSGSFTEMFRSPFAGQAEPAKPPASVTPSSGFGHPPPNEPFFPAAPQAAAAQAASGGFTQMFQALSEQGPTQQQPASGSAFGGTSQATPFQPPFAPQAPPANTPAAGGGEFTRLMQTLDQPAASAQPPSYSQPPAQQGTFAQPSAAYQPPAPLQGLAAQSPFFNQSQASSGASEYTRVMSGGAFRDKPAAATPASVAAPVAPGLAISPAKPADAAAPVKPGLSKNVIILIIVFNVLLVIALIVLAVMLMKKH